MTFQSIESRENARLKHARKVRDGRSKGEILVEGPKLANEAVRSGLHVHECFVQQDVVGQNAQIDNVLDSLNKSGAAISVISDNLLASISDTVTPQGIVLICERSAVDKESFENKVSQNRSKIPLIVGLFGVNDPSNLGASLRIAEGAGARGLITTTGSADVFSPKCVRASAGSAFRVPIWAGTGGHEVIEWARQQRMTITATAANGTRSYTESDLTGERLLIFGSETHGLDKEVLEMVDECLRIEICEPVESLNLAVTAGIILFEAKRQVISRKDSN